MDDIDVQLRFIGADEVLVHFPLISSSAICTALVAAPLRMLSETIHRFRPFFTDSSRRIRPTNVSSLSCAQIGMGYSFSFGLSCTTTPGALPRMLNTSFRSNGFSNSRLTDSL